MIRYSFKGRVDNRTILDFYRDNYVDCFVMVSEKEGLPVAIMEAESAGIPVITTNVGGISEAVEGNGILLDKNVTPEGVADAIIQIIGKSYDEVSALRINSRRIWTEKFNALKNAKQFVESIRTREGRKPKRIIFITEGYPYLLNEKSFLESELAEMIRMYDITLIACISGGITEEMMDRADDIIRGLSNEEEFSIEKFISNKRETIYTTTDGHEIRVLKYVDDKSVIAFVPYIMRYMIDKRVADERHNILKSKNLLRVRYWESIKYYARAIIFLKWFLGQFFYKSDYRDTVIYTYWNLHATLGLGLGRGRFSGATLITRAHGYDYQDEQWDNSHRKPFLSLVDSLIDKVVFVCHTGKQDYIKRIGVSDDIDKYVSSYLGCKDALDYRKVNLKKNNNDCYMIASCSSLISLKRIDFLIDALGIVKRRLPDLDLEWVHFGDGVLKEKLISYAESRLR